MAKAIMIQGTMSNVGKSVVAAGLCRVFARDGYRVAPFKSQNMALNSYVTEEGLEIGRAQAVQAECCFRKPEAAMNPILLKPTTDMGSQVIVNGRPVANMNARDYFAYKKTLVPEIMAAYEKLDRENDIIVIEGAGSPAELNLKSGDIVNMGLAKMVKAPVLLVGDINPGGIFAQLYGTVTLLEPEEQKMIRGLVINKFRGDKEILRPGLGILEEKCRVPVMGVLPYQYIDIEEEDSISRRFEKGKKSGIVKISVVLLPHISNYTDFMPLETIPYVELNYVTKPEELSGTDLVILPGTKSTMADLDWLMGKGLGSAIKRLCSQGTLVCGICGGYQMLGSTITDETGAEGYGSRRGLEILGIETRFSKEKRTVRSAGKIRKNGMFEELVDTLVEGYEIHMGESILFPDSQPLMEESTGDSGCVAKNAFGTYFHGIFENKEFCEYLFKMICGKKGAALPDGKGMDFSAYKEAQFDLLGKWICDNLDMKRVYDILWKGL